MTAEEKFEEWWHEEGSGMPPAKDEDREMHMSRVSRLAYLAGLNAQPDTLTEYNSKIALALGGMKESELWGDGGLLAATKRLCDWANENEGRLNADTLTVEDVVGAVRGARSRGRTELTADHLKGMVMAKEDIERDLLAKLKALPKQAEDEGTLELRPNAPHLPKFDNYPEYKPAPPAQPEKEA